jgi:Tfp pilus assembly protein PilF
MALSSSRAQASAAVLAVAAEPARPKVAAGALGEAGSGDALARLNAAIGELRAMAAQPFLVRSVEAFQAGDAKAAAEWALKGLEQDERNGYGWYLLAAARDKAGDFRGALQCYEAALALLPDEHIIANDLGRLAYRLQMTGVAEQLFRRFLEANPGSGEAANNLACTLRDQNRYAEAIETLRPAIAADPTNPQLWNTLGTVLVEEGEPEQALVFFDEALRCDEGFAKARYNRGSARLTLGQADDAFQDVQTALGQATDPSEQAMMRLARSTIRLCRGAIGEGWDDYEARLDPHFGDVTHFFIDRPQWAPDTPLEGRRLLLVGEQGLGDEVLFANLLPDVLEALGPEGRLTLAVEPRLVPLFARSFPEAEVGPHATYRADGHTLRGVPFIEDWSAVDLWAPLASPLRAFRRSLDAYPTRTGYLAPDPARVAHWRAALAALGPQPKVGLLWKSLKVDGARQRCFSPFEQWAPVLSIPGLCFVNLQYGDCAAELAYAQSELGLNIWQPPGIDLKHDLDDLAALCCAMDLVLGPANATSNIAAACGAPLWLVSIPAAWPRLGTDRYPWYPQARVFTPDRFNDWDPVMAEVGRALAGHFG